MQQLQFDFDFAKLTVSDIDFSDLITKHRLQGLKDFRSDRKAILDEIHKAHNVLAELSTLEPGSDEYKEKLLGKSWIFRLPIRKEPYINVESSWSWRPSKIHCNLLNLATTRDLIKGLLVLDTICVSYDTDHMQFTLLGSINRSNLVSEFDDKAENDVARFEYTSYFTLDKNSIKIDKNRTRANLTIITNRFGWTKDSQPQNLIFSKEMPPHFDMLVFSYMLNMMKINVGFRYDPPLYVTRFCESVNLLTRLIFKDVNYRHFGSNFEGYIGKLLEKELHPRYVKATGLRDLIGEFEYFKLYVNFYPSEITSIHASELSANRSINVLLMDQIQLQEADITRLLKLDKRIPKFMDIPYNKWMLGQTITAMRKINKLIYEEKVKQGQAANNNFAIIQPHNASNLSQEGLIESAQNIMSLAEFYYYFYNNDLKNFQAFLDNNNALQLDLLTGNSLTTRFVQDFTGPRNWRSTTPSGIIERLNRIALVLKSMKEHGCISQARMMTLIEDCIYDPKKYIYSSHLLDDTCRSWDRMVKDYAEDLKEIRIESTSIRTLHDELSKIVVRLSHKPIMLNNDKVYKPLHQFIEQNPVVFDKYKLVPPTSTTDMVAWGAEQRHCIGTYANRLNDQHNAFLGIWDLEAKAWLGHMMLNNGGNRGWYVVQFYGHSNRTIDRPLHAKFSDLLVKILSAKTGTVYKLPDPDKEGIKSNDKVLVATYKL